MTTTGWTSPEISAFVDEVRTHLADLRPDERDELLDGLEADLADQLADGAAWSGLGDPASYAAELRLAAGLPETPRRRQLLQRPRPDHLEQVLDRSRVRFDAAVGSQDWSRATWDVVRELRPVWWVARAWLLVTLADVFAGHSEPISIIPSLGHPLLGPVVLVAVTVGSVLVGLGRLWPGSGAERPLANRAVLLAANLVAVAATLAVAVPMPGYIGTFDPYADGYDPYVAGYNDARSEIRGEERQPGLRAAGKQVTNVFAYGPGGQPLTGIQLFDQDGEPIAVGPRSSTGQGPDRRVPCPAYNGATALFNVFPLDQASRRLGLCETDTPRQPATLPLAEVPPLPQ